MIHLFTEDCGDMHSLVAKMSYPKEIGDTPISEIEKKFHKLRSLAKKIEFAINYGGDAHTICTNVGIPLPEAQLIYNNYMEGFKGVKVYQDYCRKEVLERGYILLNPITKHKAFIYDFDRLKPIYQEEQKPGFWNYYYQLRRNDPDNEIIPEVEHYKMRKRTIQKQSINYRIQDSGAMCFKLSAIYIFNYLVKNDLLFKIKWCAIVHDENDFEVPEDMVEEFGNKVQELMEEGGKPFCTKVPLPATKTIGDFWIH